jgi:hypothetical protein
MSLENEGNGEILVWNEIHYGSNTKKTVGENETTIDTVMQVEQTSKATSIRAADHDIVQNI